MRGSADPLAALRLPPWVRGEALASLVLLLLSAWIGWEVYARLIVPAPPLNFDEAAHSLPGYYVLRDILALDLRALWGDFHIQTLWPPGFSLLQAPFLGLLGRSDESARLFAYFMLVAAVLMGIPLARLIAPKHATLAAFLAGLIALTAPGWLFVASWAMQETPVAFVSMLAFWLFLRAHRSAALRWFVLSGAALYFLFLTKFNYAAFALIAVSVLQLARSFAALRATGFSALGSVVREGAALYLPFTAGVLFWFFGGTDIVPTEVKWRDFRFFVTNESSGFDFWSSENLLFYVRVTLDWLMPSPALAVAMTLGAVWALVRVSASGKWLLALYFALGFVLATLHPLKSPRYITPLFPPLWLLAGIGGADFAHWISQRLKSLRMRHFAVALLGVCVLLVSAWSWAVWLPRLHPVWAGDAARDLRAAADQIVRWQQPGRPVLIIGTFGELSPPLFEWRLRPLPGFGNSPHPIQYDAPPAEGNDDLARVRRWLSEHPESQVTVIRVDEKSPLYRTHDMQTKNAWRQVLARAFAAAFADHLTSEVSYPRSGLWIGYYDLRGVRVRP
ncbi:MAG: glycosyltransferase family 39 protein [Anaerolineae bacterium]|nr:glycosyltransferase family 39 protein [Anaerolineae bacterium]